MKSMALQSQSYLPLPLAKCMTSGMCLKLSTFSFLHLEMRVTVPRLLNMVVVKTQLRGVCVSACNTDTTHGWQWGELVQGTAKNSVDIQRQKILQVDSRGTS